MQKQSSNDRLQVSGPAASLPQWLAVIVSFPGSEADKWPLACLNGLKSKCIHVPPISGLYSSQVVVEVQCFGTYYHGREYS